jgi:putative heme-binding domain-containing protein
MSLARTGSAADLRDLLASLQRFDFAKLTAEQRILLLRDYQLAMSRLAPLTEEQAAACANRLDALYPAPAAEWQCNHLLCELLVYLGVPSVVEKSLALLSNAEQPQDFLQYLFHLRNVPHDWTIEQRRAYFSALNHAETLEGARDYQRSLRLIRSEVAETLTADERTALGSLIQGNLTNVAVKNTGPQLQVKDWKMEDIEPRLDRVGKGRSYESGRLAFTAGQCIVCHRLGKAGGFIGPDLTGVAGRFSRRDLLMNILEPSKVIDDKYRSTTFQMMSGSTVVGLVDHEDDEAVYVRVNPASPETTGVPKGLIVSREASPISPMPRGLLNVLSETQILDLLAYLEAVGDPNHPDFQK